MYALFLVYNKYIDKSTNSTRNNTVAVLAFVKKMPNVNKQIMRAIMYGFFNFLMKAYHKNGSAKVA